MSEFASPGPERKLVWTLVCGLLSCSAPLSFQLGGPIAGSAIAFLLFGTRGEELAFPTSGLMVSKDIAALAAVIFGSLMAARGVWVVLKRAGRA